ncbi:uncharacterized protein LOC127288673 [Leptopilina boulardi]|uniref:uncharacterized protein LOC127288673 n=1 Tax=Leptopilina boulardi TaxID=63433 RepID=UPI0021F5E89A|nr:uncharacterized protein LOC127288673 [Leptopilina boulardi]
MTPEKIDWALGLFKPFKAPGGDGIYPILLQKGLRYVRIPLVKIMRTSIALGYTPEAWKMTRVVFIPKAGRASNTAAKDFRPISLTSFILKRLEKLIDTFIRQECLINQPLHSGQHAYRAGCSVETALHSAIFKI